MRRLMIITALLGALGTTTAALAARGAPITEKVLGAASISQHYKHRCQKAGRRRRCESDGATWGELRLALAPRSRRRRGRVRDTDAVRQRRPNLYPATLFDWAGVCRKAEPRPSRPQ